MGQKSLFILHCGYDGYISSSEPILEYVNKKDNAKLFNEEDLNALLPHMSMDHPLSKLSVIEIKN